MYHLIQIFYSHLSLSTFFCECFCTSECLPACDSYIPVSIKCEACSFPLNRVDLTPEVFFWLFTCRMTGRLFLLTLSILSGPLSCYGFKICAFNIKSFGDSKSADAKIMNSISRVRGSTLQCFLFILIMYKNTSQYFSDCISL